MKFITIKTQKINIFLNLSIKIIEKFREKIDLFEWFWKSYKKKTLLKFLFSIICFFFSLNQLYRSSSSSSLISISTSKIILSIIIFIPASKETKCEVYIYSYSKWAPNE